MNFPLWSASVPVRITEKYWTLSLSPEALPGDTAAGNVQATVALNSRSVPRAGSAAVDKGSVTGYEDYLVGGTDLVVNPGDITELLDQFGIVESTPELGQRAVLLHGGLVITVVDVGEEGVHLAEVLKTPAATGCGDGPVVSSTDEVRGIPLYEEIALGREGLLLEKVVVESIGEELQVLCSLEI